MSTRRGIHGQVRHVAAPGRSLRAALVLVVLVVLAGCGSTPPTSAPTPSVSTRPSTSGTATAKPRATATPSTAATSSPRPTPTVQPIAGATQTPCPGHAVAARRGAVTTGQSRNWAGYIVGATKGHVTCVEGTWTQPKVRCPSTGQTSVAIWVGIDGSSAVGSIPDASATLAQTGTVGGCANGQAQYGAWYEFLPDLRHMVQFHVPINAGDKMWAQVRWFGKGKFTATLINQTQRVGTTQTWTLHYAPLLTAEWIVEEPAASCSGGSCTFVTLARFAPVTLNGSVTVSGSNYKLAGIPFPYLRTSVNRAGKSLAVPSSLSSRGFKVTWKAS
jgi:hypothetical protein